MWSEVFDEGSGGFPILGKDAQREDDEDVTKGKEVDTQMQTDRVNRVQI